MPPLVTLHEQIAACTACALCRARTHAVAGAGSATARIFFIGEAPGRKEDETGLPFVGAAGRVLDGLLAGIGLARGDVFITSILKCRPPGNRDPQPHEIEACLPHLARQVEIISPRLIVTLGRHALGLFRPGAVIGESHGRPFPDNDYTILPLYHPAAAIYNRKLREPLARDFAIIGDFL
ncbi:MAG: uracil-DNA glycosylase [Desulfobulbaceae bacterium]|nr:uracil-DNA glycosylase [Desulfobulbaceae bacterium]